MNEETNVDPNKDVPSAQTAEVKPTVEELLKNREAELDRKNREIERLRLLTVQRQEQPKQRDPNDIRTWSDHELRAIVNSNDSSVLPYKEQANELLLDRKVDARLARQAETNKRVRADLELKEKFPEALDPVSPLSVKIDELTTKYDLDKSPAGRLVAAKLAASELNQGKSASDALKDKQEQDRVARVKGQMVDGDRPKSTAPNKSDLEKNKDLREKFLSEKSDGHKAVTEWMDDTGLRDKFNKVWGQ